jgi:hypothetical protein
MEELRKEIRSLIRRMERVPPPVGSVEAITLDRLRMLSAAAEEVPESESGALASLLGELRGFWLHSIDWCSQLSKDIERLLILYDDRTTNV